MMGGDNAPFALVDGLRVFLSFANNDECCRKNCSDECSVNTMHEGDCDAGGSTNKDISEFGLDLFGNASELSALLAKCGIDISKYNIDIHDTGSSCVVHSDNLASVIRTASGTSMYEAIRYVKDGNANAVISCGNTGVYMALSKILLKMIDNVDRPAILSPIPTNKSPCIMLDLGANTECSARNIVQFAVVGAISYTAMYGKNNPSIAILNIGTEKGKGGCVVNDAYDILSANKNSNFCGFIEACDYYHGDVDVIVTDGFSGNVALKAIEGTSKFYASMLKRYLSSSIISRAGYLLCKPAFDRLRSVADPRLYNGACFAGLSSVAIKGHGNSDAVGFANALSVALKMVKSDYVSLVKSSIEHMQIDVSDTLIRED